MTWLDFVTLFLFIFFVSLAYKRGVVLELADLACITIGGLFAFRLMRPISNFLHNGPFSGFSMTFLERFTVVVVFVTVSLILFSIGFTVQRRAKEEKYLEKDVDEKLGLVVGVLKATVVIILGLGVLFYNEAFPVREHKELKGGAVVSKFLGMSGVVSPLIYIVAPSDLAKNFINKGLGPSK